jgi:hypothetical protein
MTLEGGEQRCTREGFVRRPAPRALEPTTPSTTSNVCSWSGLDLR